MGAAGEVGTDALVRSGALTVPDAVRFEPTVTDGLSGNGFRCGCDADGGTTGVAVVDMTIGDDGDPLDATDGDLCTAGSAGECVTLFGVLSGSGPMLA